MATDLSAHYQKIEADGLALHRTVELGEQDIKRRGQACAMAVVVLALGASVFLSYNGHEAVAGIIGGTTVVGLATAFIVGKLSRPDSKSESPDETKG